MKKIVLVALFIRILLLPLTYHSDINNNVIWGIYAREFGLNGFYDFLNFGNYARPDYPPLAMLLFLAIKYIYDAVFGIFWKINISIPLFPSLIIVWLRDSGYQVFLKLPGALADLGIGYLLYKWLGQYKSKNQAKQISILYLFNPAIIYLSSLWGQLDSICTLLALLALYFLQKQKYALVTFFFIVSIMIKPTFIPLGLVIGLWAIKKHIKFIEIIKSAVVAVITLWLIDAPFTTQNPLVWILDKYKNIFILGASTLPFINLNAFNFWGAILGLDRIAANTLVAGIQLEVIAYVLSAFWICLLVFLFLRQKLTTLSFTLLMYFVIFLFFPRVHERYFFPVIALFPIALYPHIFKNHIKRLYYIISGMFLLNLYHWWWYPSIPFVVNFLENNIIEKSLSFINIGLFFYTFYEVVRLEEIVKPPIPSIKPKSYQRPLLLDS